MDDSKRNSFILKIAKMIENDKISRDEHDPKILEKYYDILGNEVETTGNHIMDREITREIVNEAFLYLKMQNTTDIDPVKEGDRFAAGFS